MGRQPNDRRELSVGSVARRRPRGVALVMVLSVVAVSSILCCAMLSASSMRAQIDENDAGSAEATLLAESGASYAVNLLRHPEATRVQGPYNLHYAGDAGLMLWADAGGPVAITVTNTAQDCYAIRSSATVRGSTRTVAADVKLASVAYTIDSAAGFNGAFNVPAAMTIEGPVVARGAVTGYTNQIQKSPAIKPASTNVVPASAEVILLNETGTAATSTGALVTDRTYTWDGKLWSAERVVGSTVTALQTTRSARNPRNVWYADSDVTLNGADVKGTIVVRGTATLHYSGDSKVTALEGMPAIVAARNVNVKSIGTVAAKLTVVGATYIGGEVTATTNNRNDAEFKVEGAILMGGSAPRFLANAKAQWIYKPEYVSKVENLTDGRVVGNAALTRWAFVD